MKRSQQQQQLSRKRARNADNTTAHGVANNNNKNNNKNNGNNKINSTKKSIETAAVKQVGAKKKQRREDQIEGDAADTSSREDQILKQIFQGKKNIGLISQLVEQCTSTEQDGEDSAVAAASCLHTAFMKLSVIYSDIFSSQKPDCVEIVKQVRSHRASFVRSLIDRFISSSTPLK